MPKSRQEVESQTHSQVGERVDGALKAQENFNPAVHHSIRIGHFSQA